MNSYKVEIDLLPGSTLDYQSNLSNVLSSAVNELNNYKTKGFKGFFFSGGDASTNSGCWLDGSYKFFDSVIKYPGLLGNALSQADGTFLTEQYIQTTGGTLFYNLTFVFDRIAGEYATEILIGGTLYYNYDYTFSVKCSGSTKVVFNKWSKPNSVVKILTMKYGFTLLCDKLTIQNLRYSNSIVAGNDILTFGILVQSGSLKVRDLGILKALNDSSILDKGVAVRILIDDAVEQRFITTDYSSTDLETIWTIQMSDDIISWENEQFEVLDYATRTLKEIVDILIPGLVYDDGLDTLLQAFTIPNSFLVSSTKWQAVVKCCQVGLFRIYKINGVIHARRII